MGKASLKQTDIEPVNSAVTLDSAATAHAPAFSNGELGQLQEILFGQQQRTTHEQISALQVQFSEQLESLGNVLHSRLNQLTESFDQSKKHIEQQFAELKNENQTQLQKISQTLNATKAELQTSISALSKSTDQDSERLSTALAENESKLRSQIKAVQNDVETEMSRSIGNLNEAKLNTQDLARLFSEFSGQLASPNAPTSK